MQTTPRGACWDGENSIAGGVSNDRVVFDAVRYEIPVGNPLRLNKLELPLEVSANKKKHPAAIYPIVLQNAVGQGRPVVRAAADEAMQFDRNEVLFKRVSWVHATHMRAKGTFQALLIIMIGKVVITDLIRAQCRIVLRCFRKC